VREGLTRLDFGCAFEKHEGWIGSDLIDYGQEHVGDILDGLPFPDCHFDMIVANHSIQMCRFDDLPRVLGELRRVLKVGGVLRILVPDAALAIFRWLDGKSGEFPIADDVERTLDGKFLRYLFWHGDARSAFTVDNLMDALLRNGFSNTEECFPHRTSSEFSEIVELDSRDDELLIVEATK
jgi:SAM-dependent methyltransferase